MRDTVLLVLSVASIVLVVACNGSGTDEREWLKEKNLVALFAKDSETDKVYNVLMERRGYRNATEEERIVGSCSSCESCCCEGGRWSEKCYEGCCPQWWNRCKPRGCSELFYNAIRNAGPRADQERNLRIIGDYLLCITV